MSALSSIRRHGPVFLISLLLGAHTGNVVASAPAADFGWVAKVTASFNTLAAHFLRSEALPTSGTRQKPFESPWIHEREFGNSESLAARNNPQLRRLIGSLRADPSVQESSLKGGTVAMLSALPTVAGRIQSSHGVSQVGAGTYSIPLWTPPGARGIQPALALVYNSEAPDTLLGPGWSLAGLSAVSRCIRTVAQDNSTGSIGYLGTDKFCLDGNRLRLTGGTYGAAGSTYQTELDTFSKVKAVGTAGSGPQNFEVWGKDGLIYEYGNTADSRVYGISGSTPYLWALNKVRDRQGNNMTITYAQSSGSFRPVTISYTQTPATSAAYNYQVGFTYTTRAAATNVSGYVGTTQVLQTKIMTAMTVTATVPILGAITVRQYNIDYSTSPTTQRPRISALQECSATDCLKPTTIFYQDGAAGVASPTTSSGSGALDPIESRIFDVDGDGRGDLIYPVYSGGSRTWYVRFASPSGYGPAVSTNLTHSAGSSILIDDFLGQGGNSLLAEQSGSWVLAYWDGGSFSGTPVSTGLAVDLDGFQFLSADIDADGLPDLLVTVAGKYIYARLNKSSGTSPSFSGRFSAFNAGTSTISFVYGNNLFAESNLKKMDFDGNGTDDLVVRLVTGGSPAEKLLYTRAGAFAAGLGSFSGFNGTLDFNNDKCTDYVSGSYLNIATCDRLGTWTQIYIGTAIYLNLDWDGDGRTDILYPSGGTYMVRRSMGDSLAAAVSTGIAAPAYPHVFDFDGDGLDDLASLDATTGMSYGVHNGAGVKPDLAISFVDGFEMGAAFAYKPIAAVGTGSCHQTSGAAPGYPARRYMGPRYVVCTATVSDGIGGDYQVNHSYVNAAISLNGRGFLGFARHDYADSRTNVITKQTYSQTFPYIGMLVGSTTFQPDGTTKIGELANTLNTLSAGAGFDTRWFPYPGQSVDDVYEVGGALNGQWITRTTTDTTVDSYGNPTAVTVATTDKSSASPYVNETFTVQTVSTITNDSGANWCLGRPHRSAVQSTLPGGGSQTRTTTASVDYVNCRNNSQTIEPGGVLEAATTYGYDSCGNVNSVSVVGRDSAGSAMAARTTTSSYGTRCQFPESVTNALSQTSTTAYNYAFGLPSSRTDPNGISVSWTYDNYARPARETRADNTYTSFERYFCDASNSYCGVGDLRSYVLGLDYNTSGAEIRRHFQFHDGYGRMRYDERRNFAGSLTNVVIGYDSRGNESYRYNPYSGYSNGYQANSYDLLSRPTVHALYDGSGVLDRQTTLAYEGRAVVITDPKTNQTTRYTDVRGKLRRVVDPFPGGTTEYTYDAFGNLLTATDPIGAVISSGYNLRGFKTSSSDPDAGSWTYALNSLGEVASQTDAKSQTTTFVYDLLGRVTSRTEAEGTSTWTWGTSSGSKNIGQLASVSGPGYSESYTYDSIGRPSTTSYSADASYQVDYAYNASTGFLDNVTYPTSTSGYRLRVQYLYQYGILNQVRDYNAPSTVWWQMNDQDAWGNPIDEQLANGVHITANHDGPTGALNWRTSGTNASSYDNHQYLTYEWDKNGNLDKRIDVNQSSLTERFYYDALDRLDYSTLNGSINLDVTLDAAGNITHKSDVGNYTYHATRKHAVSATSNGWSFSYDNNGNMLTGRGNTMSWYSYNLPNTLSDGTRSSQFFYTPDRRYWKQDAVFTGGTESTIYIGGLLEKVTSAGGTNYRHMIKAGSATVIVSRHSAGVNSTYYVTQDSLGSSAAVTNDAGTLMVVQNFDAYGKRRGNTGWTGAPGGADWTAINSTSRRGYTGHTMVDTLNYTHMNGRMYDPVIGRFIQPDPIIQDISASQSLNPYSYVWNNPLKYTDPSGFKVWESVKGWFNENVVAPVRAFFGQFGNGIVDIVNHAEDWLTGWFTDEDRLGMQFSPSGGGGDGGAAEMVVTGRRERENEMVVSTQGQIQSEIDRAFKSVGDRWYKNEAAAVSAIAGTGIDEIGRSYDIEIGAVLFRRPSQQSNVNAPTYVGAAVTQFERGGVNPVPGSRPPTGGYSYAGYIHTHPNGGGNGFSPGDIYVAQRTYMGNAYLLAPDGKTYVYDYHAATSAGHVGGSRNYVREFKP